MLALDSHHPPRKRERKLTDDGKIPENQNLEFNDRDDNTAHNLLDMGLKVMLGNLVMVVLGNRRDLNIAAALNIVSLRLFIILWGRRRRDDLGIFILIMDCLSILIILTTTTGGRSLCLRNGHKLGKLLKVLQVTRLNLLLDHLNVDVVVGEVLGEVLRENLIILDIDINEGTSCRSRRLWVARVAEGDGDGRAGGGEEDGGVDEPHCDNLKKESGKDVCGEENEGLVVGCCLKRVAIAKIAKKRERMMRSELMMMKLFVTKRRMISSYKYVSLCVFRFSGGSLLNSTCAESQYCPRRHQSHLIPQVQGCNSQPCTALPALL